MSEPLEDAATIAWEGAFAETGNPIYAMLGALDGWRKDQRPPEWAEVNSHGSREQYSASTPITITVRAGPTTRSKR